MNVLFVSTFRQPCGIATYTEKLARALVARGHRVGVLAERLMPDHYAPRVRNLGDESGEVGGVKYNRVWDRLGPLRDMLARFPSLEGTIIHVQHEFGLFPRPENLRELYATVLAKGGIPIVTYHTVLAPPRQVGFFVERSHATVIVHTLAGAAILAGAYGQPARVIPHGVDALPREFAAEPHPDKIPWNGDRTIGLCPGFLSPSKGHPEIIRALGLAVGAGTNLHLVIAGEPKDPGYLAALAQKIDNFGLADRVTLLPSFQASLKPFLDNADFVILGATDSTSPYSASGQLADAIGAGCPVLAKNVPIYRSSPGGVLYYSDAEECALFLRAMPAMAMQLRGASEAAQVASWEASAIAHEEVYQSLLPS